MPRGSYRSRPESLAFSVNRAWLGPAIVGGFAVLMRLPSLWEPRWYSDEGVFTVVAWANTHGLALYSQVFDVSPPGIYWLHEIFLGLGAGTHHVVIQLAGMLAALSAALLTYAIARQLFPGNVPGTALAGILCAFALCLPTLDGDLLNVELAGLPFFLGALLLSLGRGALREVSSGVLLAGALLIRPSYAADSLAILYVVLTQQEVFPRFLRMAVGGITTFALAALAVLFDGGLSTYILKVLPVDRAYLLWANGNSYNPLILRGFALLALALAWSFLVRSWNARLVGIWLAASVFGSSLTPRELTHYIHEAAPPLAIALGTLAFSLRPLFRPLAVPAAAVIFVLGCEAILVLPVRETAFLVSQTPPRAFLHNFSYSGLGAYYAHWFRYATGQEARTKYLASFPAPVLEEAREAAQLKALARPGDRLLVMGDRPWLYLLSGLQPASPYVAQNTGYRLLPGVDDETAAALDRAKGQLVVLADAPPGDWEGRLRADGYQQVEAPWPIFVPAANGASAVLACNWCRSKTAAS